MVISTLSPFKGTVTPSKGSLRRPPGGHGTRGEARAAACRLGALGVLAAGLRRLAAKLRERKGCARMLGAFEGCLFFLFLYLSLSIHILMYIYT